MIALSLLLLQSAAPYSIVSIPAPARAVLEVGGLATLPGERLLVSTRRGEIWAVDGAHAPAPVEARFTLFAQGLQEPLGLLVHEGWIYTVQRGELSRMRDADGDGFAEELETVSDRWRISGNYHEYNFGPRLGPDGQLWITTNKPFGPEPFGRVDWRGFALSFTLDGKMTPVACGLRSPAGIEASPWGDMFYTDNQGEWCGASKLAHIEPGDFHGHPWGVFSCKRPEWKFATPATDPELRELMPEVSKSTPSFKLPAIWFPYDKMGKSPSGLVWDTSEGAFGPFAGQLFVGDQHHAAVLRVFLEEVNGHWQGACFRFRDGFDSGVIRLAFSADGSSLFAGLSNRGWGSRGKTTHGLQRLDWTGRMPFEIAEMRARSRGFALRFTEPVDPELAARTSTYALASYTYELHSDYGSDEMDPSTPQVTAVAVSADGLEVKLDVNGLRAGYVHELSVDGLRSKSGVPLLHTDAYYTLIEIPELSDD